MIAIDDAATKAARLLGSRGGKAAARLMTPDQRKVRAKKASAERWKKYRKQKKGA